MAAGLVAVWATATSSSHAASFTWNDPAGGLFGDSANWSPVGVPGSADSATFALNNTYTVTFASSVSNSDYSIDAGNVTFELSGFGYTLLGSTVADISGASPRLTLLDGTISGAGLRLAAGPTSSGAATISFNSMYLCGGGSVEVGNGGAASLNIVNGGDFGCGTLFVGQTNTGRGSLTISGSSSAVTCGSLDIGFGGTGTMNILSGGSLNCTSTFANANILASNSASTAVVNVSGLGANWTTSGGMEVGDGGAATLSVSNSGHVGSASGVVLGFASGSNGTVSISGNGSKWDSAGSFDVGEAGFGTLNLTNGGVLNCTSNQVLVGTGAGVGGGNINLAGTGATLNCGSMIVGSSGNGSLTVSAGGAVNVGGDLTVGDPVGAPMGVITLDGGSIACRSFVQMGTFNFNDGTLTVNGGSFQIGGSGGPLVIDSSSSATHATLNVIGGGSINNLTDLTVGNANNASLIANGAEIFVSNATKIAATPTGAGEIDLDHSLLSTGSLVVGAGGFGTLTIGPGSTVDVFNSASVFGRLNLTGGILQLFTNQLFLGGTNSVHFDSGTIEVASFTTLSGSTLDALLGPSHILSTGQGIFTSGTLTVLSPLTINGGILGASSGADQTVLLQDNLVINSGGVSTAGSGGNVSNFGQITLSGSGFIDVGPSSAFANSGAIQLSGGSCFIRVGGASSFSNAGTIRGSGQIIANVTNFLTSSISVGSAEFLDLRGSLNNSGLLSVIGGEAQIGACTNNAAGSIAGHDSTLRFTSGLTNAGSMLFTAGQSDVFGNITNNTGGKIIVSGGGIATFYNPITNNAGAELRVGTSSTGVFFGAVNGSGSITGSGLKIFEGGTSSMGPLATQSGSTIVEVSAAITADNVREHGLTVSGQLSVRPNGTDAATSRLHSLLIDSGTFDLNDNDLVIDYSGANPYDTIRGYIASSALRSSLADAAHRLGYADNATRGLATFSGQSVDPTSILIKFTYGGDANLDGQVDVTDLGALATNWQTPSDWTGGDFNYDGFVDVTDLGLLATNWQAGVGDPLAPSIDQALRQVGLTGMSVPEPGAGLIGVLLAMLALAPVRRRRSRRLFIGAIALLGLVVWNAPASAQTLLWNNPAGGTFNVAANWNPATVPTLATQTAVFSLAGPYTVSFTANASNGTLLFQSGAATFTGVTFSRSYALSSFFGVSGGTLTLGTNISLSAPSISIASGATLRMVPGALLASTGDMVINGLLDQSGNGLSLASGRKLTISGAGASYLRGSGTFRLNNTISVLNGGSFSDSANMNFGDSGGAATLLVSGAGSRFSTGPGSTSLWGAGSGGTAIISFANSAAGSLASVDVGSGGGVANVSVDTGASLTFSSDLVIGSSGGSGTLSLAGGTSSLNMIGTSLLDVGSSGAGTLAITGGTLTTSTAATAIDIGTTGFVSMTGGAMQINGGLSIAGQFNQTAGLFLLGTGRNVQVTGSFIRNGTGNFSDSNTLSVLNGGSYSSTLFTDIGNGGAGTLLVDGAGSRYASGNSSFWGSGSTGAATLVFSNGGSGSISQATLARSGGSGQIFVTSGASLTLQSLVIGNAAGSVGSLTVSGTESSVSVGSFNLAGQGGAGSITIADGTFSTGTLSTSTIGLNGTVSVTGGRFNINSDLVINGFLSQGFGGIASVAPGRNVTVAGSGAELNRAQFSPFLSPGDTLMVLNGAHYDSSDTTDLGDGGAGTLVVDGAGTIYDDGTGIISGRNALWAINGGSANVTFSNSAVASLWGFSLGGDPGFIPTGGTGNVSVTTGAHVGCIQGITVGGFVGSAATLSISDSTTVVNTRLLEVGPAGNGTVNVQSGGSLQASFTSIGSTGSVLLSSAFFQAQISLSISGLLSLNDSTLTLSNSGIITVRGPSGQLIRSGTGTLNHGTLPFTASGIGTLNALKILSGGTYSSDGVTDIAGTLLVDGAGSTYRSLGSANWSGGFGPAGITFSNGAVGTLDSINQSSGNVLIASGSSVVIGGDLSIGVGGIADFTLQDSTSSATMTGPTATLTLGENSTIGGTLDVLGGTFTAGGGAVFVRGTGTINLANGGRFIAPGSIDLTGEISMNGGDLSAGTINRFAGAFPGTLNFNAGTLQITASDVTIDSTGLFGVSPAVLNSPKALIVDQLVHLAPGGSLSLSGGTLSAGSLSLEGGEFAFESGTLRLTNSDFVVGSSGLLGALVDLKPGQRVETAGTFGARIQSDAVLQISGGVLFPAGGTSNDGQVVLTSPLATIGGGTFSNSGLLSGDGQVLAPLSNQAGGEVRVGPADQMRFGASGNDNAGLINLQGGVADFVGSLSNSATGRITGRGMLKTASLLNSGTVALSAGPTDVFGSVDNSPGSKIIVSGGAVATFYDNVTNDADSEFRVSTASTAVFFGPVSGSGQFTGPGTKDFESIASPGPLVTSGSTIVGPDATLNVPVVRETSLEISGIARVLPNGTTASTSRENALTIAGTLGAWSGQLDLADNDLIIDYDGSSPLSTVRDQILSGFNHGAWNGNGIISSLADATHRLGYADNATRGLATFSGQSVDSTSILIKFTYAGDSNLDGQVDVTDLGALATNWQTPSDWTGGDFNYDGFVDVTDLGILATNWQAGVGNPLGLSFDQALLDVGLGPTSLPEPALPTTLLILLTGASMRRRRCR